VRNALILARRIYLKRSNWDATGIK